MKDRRPKYPGRVKLTKLTGDLYQMDRADDPNEAGTPINKQTLLTDATAKMYGFDPSDDPTPNRIFGHIGRYTVRKAGDVLETMRTDPGDGFVLCDGRIIPEDEYPELRDVLPYNTAYRRLPFQTNEYPIVRPLPVPGQWFFCKDVFSGGLYGGIDIKKAMLYDEQTDTFAEIIRPTISDATNYGIFGLTHNGKEYVLGVTRDDRAGDTNVYKLYIYTSSDLTTWTKKLEYTFSKRERAFDLSYNGTEILFTLYRSGYADSQQYWYTQVCYIDADMTTVKEYVGGYNGLAYFAQLPHPYWALQMEETTGTQVRKAGNSSSWFTFSWYPGIAFFNDKYWVGAPLKGQESASSQRFNVVDLTTEQVTSIYYPNITGVSNSLYEGIEYDPNTREWMLYFGWANSGATVRHYVIAYISEDADPRDVSNYRVVDVGGLPEKLSNMQMSPNRTRLLEISATERCLRNPNIKCLPNHEGDTYKYIYVGGNESGSGDDDDGGGGNTGGGDTGGDTGGEEISKNVSISDDGAGNVTIRMESGESVKIADDSAGNITITTASGDAVDITDDGNGNVIMGG